MSWSCLTAELAVAAEQKIVTEEVPGVDPADQKLELHNFAAGQKTLLAEEVSADLGSPAADQRTQLAEKVAAALGSLPSGSSIAQGAAEVADLDMRTE